MTRVLFFMPSLADGGAERVTVDLCSTLAEGGDEVTLALAEATGPTRPPSAAGVEVADLRASRTVTALPALTRLIRRQRPDVVVGVMAHAGVVAALAHRLSRSRARLLVVQHNQMSLNVAHSPRARDRWLARAYGVLFRRVDTVCAVSAGVADDFAATTGISRGRVEVIGNPIDFQSILERAASDRLDQVSPELVTAADEKLVVAAGRLVPQKDFGTLLHAAARLSCPRWRLVVLGEGAERARLEGLRDSLGLADRVFFPGHVANPYPAFRAADLYVMSSRWEGLPTVLLEVMAFETPIVSTDCPSGPREILDDGRYGRLVPVDDPDRLSAAMDEALASPELDDRSAVRAAFAPEAIAARFRDTFSPMTSEIG